MNQLLQRLACYWILATVLHLPLPMIDGDGWCEFNAPQAGHEQTQAPAPRYRIRICGFEINYFFVGCPAPEDLDHGPVDPESETDLPMLGAYPLFLKAGELTPLAFDWQPLNTWNFLAIVPQVVPEVSDATCSFEPDMLPRGNRPYAAHSPVIRC